MNGAALVKLFRAQIIERGKRALALYKSGDRKGALRVACMARMAEKNLHAVQEAMT